MTKIDEAVFRLAGAAAGFKTKGPEGDRLRLFVECYLSNAVPAPDSIAGSMAAARALRQIDPSMSKAASLMLGKAAADAVLATRPSPNGDQVKG